MDWYLLQAKANAHTLARNHLNRQGFQVFLPLKVSTSKRGGKFVNRLTPLFPNYLFIGTKQKIVPWKSINATRGISKAVTLDGHYRPINAQIIDGIKCRCDQKGVLQAIDVIASGDRVKIERGPFTDFICNIEKIADNQRAWVLINMMQNQTKVQVPLESLSRID